MRALQLVEMLRRHSPSAANLVLSHALPAIIPLSGGLGMRIEELTDLRASATLPLRLRTRNHVGSVYFGAQMTLAELTMGLLLFKLYPPGPFGMLVKRVEADFLAKGKGELRAVCEPGPEVFAALAAARDSSDGKAEAWVPVSVTLAKDGSPVTNARFLAAVKRFDRR